MRELVFTIKTVLTEKEFETLKKISKRIVVYNYTGPKGTLELCDSLRDKGLIHEDGNGRVGLTHRGVAFVNAEIKKSKN
jgi:Mn-dependent DtxR family transcriptional regulator